MKTLNFQFLLLFVILLIPSCDQNSHEPEIADQTFYLDENSKSGTLVGKIEADDLDEQQTLSFEILEGNTNDAFILDNKTGDLLVNNTSVLDYEKIKKIDLQILVSDNHPNDPLESSANISVVLNNLNEHAPVIEDQAFTVEERSLKGAVIGNIVATDSDSGQTLSFRIESGNENQVLQLDSLTGEISVKDSAWFDYTINQELVCMVSVCDNDSKNPFRSFALITIEVEDVPFLIIDLEGYVQKGPFIAGSTITVSELQADLQPTGRVFSAQIANNSGKFNLPNVELESQYLHLKADGFYFNERTGELSEAQISLNSLVDITNHESFNVNIITHLENDRIKELMDLGLGFTEAKNQSKDEILSIFKFRSVEQLQSEQMDIVSPGEDNAMLLAVSLIMQGNRSTGEFSEIINQISLDFKEDGSMDNTAIGSELINGINYANLENIRNLIEQRYESLGVEYEIPDFEKYVNWFISTTNFIPTNEFEFPATGAKGNNFLNPELSNVQKNEWGNFVVNVPEDRSLIFDVIHENSMGFEPHSAVNLNCGTYSQLPDGSYHNRFETTSSGECSLNVLIYEGGSNTIKINYYFDGETTPSLTNTLQKHGGTEPPADSTSIK